MELLTCFVKMLDSISCGNVEVWVKAKDEKRKLISC